MARVSQGRECVSQYARRHCHPGCQRRGAGPERRYVFTGWKEHAEPNLKEIPKLFTDRKGTPQDFSDCFPPPELREFLGGRVAVLYVDELAGVLRVYRKWEGRAIGMATLVNLCLQNQIDLPFYRMFSEEVCLYLSAGKLLDERMERFFQSLDGHIESASLIGLPLRRGWPLHSLPSLARLLFRSIVLGVGCGLRRFGRGFRL